MAPVTVRPMSLRLQWNMYRLINEVEISIGYAQLRVADMRFEYTVETDTKL